MMGDVGQIARHQIIHRHHPMPLGNQAVSHMTANETGPAGNQNSHFISLLVKTERKRDGGKERWRERAVISTPLDLSFSLSLPLSLSSSSDSSILKSNFFYRRRIEHIPPVHEYLLVHHLADLTKV